MADFNQPTNSTLYSDVLSTLNSKISSVSKLDYTGDTNVPTGAWRLTTATGLLETWSGSAWTAQGYVLKSSSVGVASFAGSLGINATSPAIRLQVDGGTINVGGLSSPVAIFCASASSTNNAGIVLGSITGNTPYIAASKLGNGSSTDLPILTADTERMRIMSTGRVGIGTSAPTGQFDVSGGVLNGGGISGAYAVSVFTLDKSQSTYNKIVIENLSGNTNYINHVRQGSTAGAFNIGTVGADDLKLRTNNTDRILINSSGAVGINTSSPQGTFSVKVNNDQDFAVGIDVTGNKIVESRMIYDQTTSFGSAVNVELTGGKYLVRRSTSSAKYKKDIETLEQQYAEGLLQLRPVYYRSKSSTDVEWFSTYGLIAEEVAEIDPRLAVYRFQDSDYEDQEVTLEDGTVTTKKVLKQGSVGEAEGVNYNAVLSWAIKLIQGLHARVEALEAE